MAVIILTDSVDFAKARIAAIGYKPDDGRIVYVHSYESYLKACELDCDTPWFEVLGAASKLEHDIGYGMKCRFGEPHKSLMGLLELLKVKLRVIEGGLSIQAPTVEGEIFLDETDAAIELFLAENKGATLGDWQASTGTLKENYYAAVRRMREPNGGYRD